MWWCLALAWAGGLDADAIGAAEQLVESAMGELPGEARAEELVRLDALLGGEQPEDDDQQVLWMFWRQLQAEQALAAERPQQALDACWAGHRRLTMLAGSVGDQAVLGGRITLWNLEAEALGLLHREGEALERMERVIGGLEQLLPPEDPQLGIAQHNIGQALLIAGDPEGALERFERAEPLLLDELHRATLWLARSRALVRLLRYDEALRWAERGHEVLVAQLGEEAPLTQDAQVLVARGLRYGGRCAEALGLLDPLVVDAGPALQARLQEERAMCLLDLDAPAKAAEAMESALASTAAGDSDRMPRLLELANVRMTLDDVAGARDAALEVLALATRALEDQLGQLPDRVRLARVEEDFYLLGSLLGVLRDPADQAAVYGAVLRWKSAARQSLRAQRQVLLDDPSPEVREALGRLGEIRRTLAERSVADEALPVHLRDERDRIELQLAQRASAQRQLPSPRQLCAALPADGALVDYLIWQDLGAGRWTLSAFVLTPVDCSMVHRVDLTDAEPLVGDLEQYVRRLAAGSVAIEGRERRAQSVREALWDPLLPVLGGQRRVWVVPHHELGALNLETLPAADGRYLLEDWQLHVLDGADELVRPRTAGGTGALVVASDEPAQRPVGCQGEPLPGLPGVRAEARAVQRVLRRARLRPQVHTGAQVGSLPLAELVRGHRVVHLAAHGALIDPDCRPEALPLARSGLVLTGETQRWLSAEEVALWDLRGTELVTLSACSVGRGEVGLAGTLGMRWALSVAGAKSVLSALWTVDDAATVALMEDFYRRWLGGQPLAEALRDAKLAVLAERRSAEGLGRADVWGAFVLTGSQPL